MWTFCPNPHELNHRKDAQHIDKVTQITGSSICWEVTSVELIWADEPKHREDAGSCLPFLAVQCKSWIRYCNPRDNLLPQFHHPNSNLILNMENNKVQFTKNPPVCPHGLTLWKEFILPPYKLSHWEDKPHKALSCHFHHMQKAHWSTWTFYPTTIWT